MATILIIDDEPDSLDFFAKDLVPQNSEATVYTAETDEEAIEILQTKKIDVILEDLNRPKHHVSMIADIAKELGAKHKFLTGAPIEGKDIIQKWDFVEDCKFFVENLLQAA